MRGEKGIQKLKEELQRLTGFIDAFGTDEDSGNEDVDFANDVLDTLGWVIGDISDKEFREAPFVNMPRLRAIVRKIEERTGERWEDYTGPSPEASPPGEPSSTGEPAP